MLVESLYVRNFRNLAAQEIVFGDCLNEFIGQNAHGKTAFLEAINLFIVGCSFRTAQLRDLVSFGQHECFLKASVASEGVRTELAFQYNMQERGVYVNGVKQASSTSLLGNLLGVSCGLQDSELIFGPPSVRRRFLDQQIAQIDPFYVDQLRRYNRALLQRNCLLRTHDLRSIKGFEEQLAKTASYIIAQRKATTDALNALVVPFYQSLFDAASSQLFEIRYRTQCPSNDVFSWHMDQYERRRQKEERLSMTLIGPHRDDLDLLLDDRVAKGIGSCAQVRAMGLALRLAEWSLLKTRSSQMPIFLIDDLTNSFDGVRTKKLLDICAAFGQVFVSNCEAVSVDSRRFEMVKGVACPMSCAL